MFKAKPLFVGLGHPRCGTGFTAGLLQNAGLDVGHERLRKDGIVSWCLASEADAVPWGHPMGPLKRSHNVSCVARSPRSAIPSIVPETMKPRSYNFIRRTVNNRYGTGTLPGIEADGLVKSVRSFTFWFDMCLALKPELIFRVEVEADDAELSNYIGRTVSRSQDINRNHKHKHKKPEILQEDYCALPADDLEKLCYTSERLGYPDDAMFFASCLK